MKEEKFLQQLCLSLKNADIITYQSNTKVNITIGRERVDDFWWWRDENPEQTEENPEYGDVYIDIHIPFYEKENNQIKYSDSGLPFTITFSKLYNFYATINIPKNDTVLTMTDFACINHENRVNQNHTISYNPNYTFNLDKLDAPFVNNTSKIFSIKSLSEFLDILNMLKDVTVKRDYIDLNGQKHQDLVTFSIDADKISKIIQPIAQQSKELHDIYKNINTKLTGIL